jgi:SAM-dependent methyltransferase
MSWKRLVKKTLYRLLGKRVVLALLRETIENQQNMGGFTEVLGPDLLIDVLSNQDALHRGWGHALHWARMFLVRQLPKARVICDLGGMAQGSPLGGLVVMGYPYEFETLNIIELPRELRHDLYKGDETLLPDGVPYRGGTIQYIYSGMTDLSALADASVDLVWSGNSIEHVTESEADVVFEEVRRVLRPEGAFCLDTPNSRATRAYSPRTFMDPDHKVEYEYEQLKSKLERAGFRIVEEKGACWVGESIRSGKFDVEEVWRNRYIYDDIVNCFFLYFRCEKAERVD